VRLDEVARGVLADLHEAIAETGGEVHVGPLPELRADPVQMGQLLQNLIGNGLKFHPPGVAPRVHVSAGQPGDGTVVLRVRDEGIGFDAAYLDRIFTPFERLHARSEYPGTGMGLAICRRIVERHGGAIGVADNPGGGTRFHFTLPLAGPEVQPPAGPPRTEVTMPEPDPAAASESAQAQADRVALERALAERAAVQHAVLPGLLALPPSGPSARESSAARLQAPVPDHHAG
jgi:hypothetical protein